MRIVMEIEETEFFPRWQVGVEREKFYVRQKGHKTWQEVEPERIADLLIPFADDERLRQAKKDISTSLAQVRQRMSE